MLFAPKCPSVLNWRCRLMMVDLYNGHKMVVVVLLCSVNSVLI